MKVIDAFPELCTLNLSKGERMNTFWRGWPASTCSSPLKVRSKAQESSHLRQCCSRNGDQSGKESGYRQRQRHLFSVCFKHSISSKLSYRGETMHVWRSILMHVCTSLLLTGEVMIAAVFGGGPDPLVDQKSDVSTGVVSIAALPSRAGKHVGAYPIGRDVRVKIDLKNSLGSPLNLRDVDPDCGCLAVVPEKRHMKPDGRLTLSLTLDSSNKIATVRRSIRLFFHESNHPFVLDIDVSMTGPLALSQATVQLTEPDELFNVFGRVEEVGGRIQRIESLRGSFVTSGSVVQKAEAFKFNARPTFSFGAVDDLVRIHYRNPEGDLQAIDLPIRLHFTMPLRFLPSTLHLASQSTEWVGAARMIVLPGKLKVARNQLRYVVESKSRPGQASYEVAVRGRDVSSIMSVVEVVITEGKQVANLDDGLFPDRLLVYGPDNELVGILNLVRERGN
ncbi:MAG: hypothetical protein CBE00_05280 [Planctomycetaceae bacterium TMED240]|nr:hypothetical protein [Rhodopirellula sp.]OUX07338.1 MAG: hypothetical protein CBE00_05280 [Planctomycetaceae bacterium TMED240]